METDSKTKCFQQVSRDDIDKMLCAVQKFVKFKCRYSDRLAAALLQDHADKPLRPPVVHEVAANPHAGLHAGAAHRCGAAPCPPCHLGAPVFISRPLPLNQIGRTRSGDRSR